MDPREIVRRGYDRVGEEYTEWTRRGGGGAREPYTTRLLQSLPTGAEVLDLGCGAGIPTALRLAGRFRVTGVDLSSRQIDLARRNVPHAGFVRADMLSVEFAPRSFEAVTAFYSITHLPRSLHAALLDRVFEWLVPGGTFVASLGASETEGVEDDWLGAPMYFSHHDSDTNKALVEAAGFEIEDSKEITESEDGEPVTFLWVIARRPTQT